MAESLLNAAAELGVATHGQQLSPLRLVSEWLDRLSGSQNMQSPVDPRVATQFMLVVAKVVRSPSQRQRHLEPCLNWYLPGRSLDKAPRKALTSR